MPCILLFERLVVSPTGVAVVSMRIALTSFHPVVRLLLARLGFGLLTLLAVSIVIFSGIKLLPGDFAEATLGQSVTPEVAAELRAVLGLDQSAITTYWHWLTGVLHGDFGTSFAGLGSGDSRPVSALVLPRLSNTAFLATLTAVIAVPMAVILGVLTALYRNSIFDRSVNFLSLGAVSLPEFFIAYVLVLLFSAIWPLFPAIANISPSMPFSDKLIASVLPAMTLTLVIMAQMLRMTRAAIISILSAPFIEMAVLKGQSKWRIIVVHALPNAIAPIVTVVAFNLAYLVAGVVVVESVFVYPGVGQLMVDSVMSRDIPVVQACALIFAATYVGLNLVADIASVVSNPRLLYPR
jgi:peptide/nickel transport system permease protein